MTDQSILIQIYEIQSPGAAEPLIAMGVDHIGSVILDEQHWKNPEIKDTVRLVSESGARSSLLPLFSEVDAVSRVLDYYQPDIIHFCESVLTQPDQLSLLDRLCKAQMKIKERFPEIKIMRSLPIRPLEAGTTGGLSHIISRFEILSDYFLTDTVLPVSGQTEADHQPVPGFVGITGVPCDWDAVSRLVEITNVPVILAGGISPDNVYEAIGRTHPAGVDSCTRTNRVDGRGGTVRFEKDYKKVKRLIEEVRRAEADNLGG